MDPIWQILVNGVGLGAVYGLVAVGIQLIIGVSGVPNFANGQFYMLGGYVLFLILGFVGIGYFPSLFLCILILAGIGAIAERISIRPLMERPRSAGLISTLALGMFIEGLILILFTAEPKTINTPYSGIILSIGDVSLSVQRIIMAVGGVGAFVLADFFVRKTKVGKGLRAMSQNKQACRIFGIDIFKMSRIAFMLGVALAAFAAGLVVPLFALSPFMGSFIIFKAFAVVIIAGIGEIRGVMFAALLVGLTESLASFYIDPLFRDVTAFLFMICVLLIRPQGIFGEKSDLLFAK